MKNSIPIFFFSLAIVTCYSFVVITFVPKRKGNQVTKTTPIGVIELRNYLIKNKQANAFNTYFTEHFQKPMQDMEVSVLGKFKIKNDENHFVWIRGYENGAQRVKFLNDFYYKNKEWIKYKKGANELIGNSDNVYLLKPFLSAENQGISSGTISSAIFNNEKSFVVVDFYIANTRLNELKAFFDKEYCPILKSVGMETTLWVSVTEENDFPQLPVFQDKNLLVAITFYKNENDYKSKSKLLNAATSNQLKIKMLDIVTTHQSMELNPFK
ncbi:MAG: hypothetical protein ABIQ27_10280 [Flavobacterium sp.]|uniref:hypothetical protein n=1 Tax=Flavobacterium sp. TaxID=239 RepID=UPI003265BF27